MIYSGIDSGEKNNINSYLPFNKQQKFFVIKGFRLITQTMRASDPYVPISLSLEDKDIIKIHDSQYEPVSKLFRINCEKLDDEKYVYEIHIPFENYPSDYMIIMNDQEFARVGEIIDYRCFSCGKSIIKIPMPPHCINECRVVVCKKIDA
mgnify:CR=1 FL=1